MHFFDVLRGAGIVLFIVVLAGAIAYMGDRVGHQVGRKRLTLFNIRPRYTSTIIAVATGMIIALVVTLGAIFASGQVKTAFFRLNEINAEIQRAQSRARELERKVTSEHVVIDLYSLMSPTVGRIPLNAPEGLRRDRIQDFYENTVSYVNNTYTKAPFDLKPFVPPSNVGAMLDSLAQSPKLQAAVTQSDVLLLATADQNLYPHDAIHFGITFYPDRLISASGQPIASIVIPGGKNVSADLALSELLGTYVPRQMENRGMPPFFASRVVPKQLLPAIAQMQTMVTGGKGTYIMTAFAASNVYPHTFQVPVVVTLQKAPAQ